jgi:vacuolar-type H+-ATPase subunit E/Vma4
MALAEILDALRREGDEEIARITAEREATVGELMQSARPRAKQEEAVAATGRDEALAREADVIAHRAELHVERRLQEAREAVFQEILGRAEDRLSRLRADPGYPATLEALLDECRTFLGTVKVVLVDPRDVGLVESILDRTGPAELEPSLECWGGIVAHDGKGVFVRNTLEERLGRAEAELRKRVSELVPGLGGRSGPGGTS